MRFPATSFENPLAARDQLGIVRSCGAIDLNNHVVSAHITTRSIVCRESVVQIRSVVMIALLAICRKVIILDLKETDPSQTFALAAAILALGLVYWLIRDSDQRLVGGA
jgi:Phosphate-starvation-inducible E family